MRSGYQLGRKNGAVQAEQTSVELDHACLSPSFYYNVSIIFKMSQQTLPFITLISRFARCNSSGRHVMYLSLKMRQLYLKALIGYIFISEPRDELI